MLPCSACFATRLRLIAAAIIMAVCVPTAKCGGLTGYVNPFIGTGAVNGSLSGNDYPGATCPFGMVQLSPDTSNAPDWSDASGYDYNRNIIYGFSHTHLSGTGAADLIDILLMPTSSDLAQSSFSHKDESASPGYYQVRLADENINVELTATTRTGIHRYTFPVGKDENILLDLDHSADKGSWNRRIISSQIRIVDNHTVEGYRIITGWARLRKVCFRLEFSRPVISHTLMDGGQEYAGADVINGTNLHARFSFDPSDGNPLVCKVALSPVSTENAALNMRSEAPHWDFDQYRASANDRWEEALGRIKATASQEKMEIFYTALYHALLQPNTFSDVNGEYMASDCSVRRAAQGHTIYTTFSLWDTFRGAHPLYTLIAGDRVADFVGSLVSQYKHYGCLPIWQLWGQENYCMIGNHSIPVIADAILKGVPGIDPEEAYKAVVGSATTPHPNSPFDVWEKYGFMPEDIQTQSVSITLEQAFDDWCVSLLAHRLGKVDDEKRFARRAGFYKNLYNLQTHFFQPKDKNGKWIEPFDPYKYGANGGSAFTEGNAWQYYWYVPHAIDSLIELTGGKKAFEQKLDRFFTDNSESGARNDNASGLIGQYAHGNEPSHHVAYLYNDAGVPWKTQRMVSKIMTTLYNTSSSGYAGNDDCGEMSAWYVFSAMGFYPVNPVGGEYSIGSPAVDQCVIYPEGGKKFTITVKRTLPTDIYIKTVRLNGKPLKRLVLTHRQIVGGGTLEFVMKSKP